MSLGDIFLQYEGLGPDLNCLALAQRGKSDCNIVGRVDLDPFLVHCVPPVSFISTSMCKGLHIMYHIYLTSVNI